MIGHDDRGRAHAGPERGQGAVMVAVTAIRERIERARVNEQGRHGKLRLHGRLPHGSAPNRSARSRHAYTLHVIDGSCAYLPDNWLQRPGLPLRGF
jgi:hypothetical protein